MTYNELNNLFETLATAMGYEYENGPQDQLNTVLMSSATKYPIIYSLPFIQLLPKPSDFGPEWLVTDRYDVQIAFLDIDGTTNRTPNTNNAQKRSIINEQFNQAKIFLNNLYGGSLNSLAGAEISKAMIEPLTLFYSMNGATGALLSFEISTIATFDCNDIVI